MEIQITIKFDEKKIKSALEQFFKNIVLNFNPEEAQEELPKDQLIDRVRELAEENKKPKEIADILGIKPQQVYYLKTQLKKLHKNQKKSKYPTLTNLERVEQAYEKLKQKHPWGSDELLFAIRKETQLGLGPVKTALGLMAKIRQQKAIMHEKNSKPGRKYVKRSDLPILKKTT